MVVARRGRGNVGLAQKLLRLTGSVTRILSRLLGLGLTIPHGCVSTIEFKELCVRALLDDGSLVKYKNLVCVCDCRKTMPRTMLVKQLITCGMR